jgi:hypothetical protein
VRTGDEVAGYTVHGIHATNVELGNTTGQMVTLYLQLAPSRGGNPGVPGAGPRRPAAAGPPTAPPPSSGAGAQATRTPPVDEDAAMRRRMEERWNQRRLQQQRKSAPAPGIQRRSGLMRTTRKA